MRNLLFTSMLIGLIVSRAQAQSAADIRKTIEANNRSFIEAFNKGDAKAVAEMYTNDARLLPPNSPMIEARSGIESFWRTLIAAGVKVVKLEIASLETSGNLVVEVGKYTLTIPKAGGDTMTDEGKYVVVWKRQGRNWKLAVDTFNTSLPLPGQ